MPSAEEAPSTPTPSRVPDGGDYESFHTTRSNSPWLDLLRYNTSILTEGCDLPLRLAVSASMPNLNEHRISWETTNFEVHPIPPNTPVWVAGSPDSDLSSFHAQNLPLYSPSERSGRSEEPFPELETPETAQFEATYNQLWYPSPPGVPVSRRHRPRTASDNSETVIYATSASPTPFYPPPHGPPHPITVTPIKNRYDRSPAISTSSSTSTSSMLWDPVKTRPSGHPVTKSFGRDSKDLPGLCLSTRHKNTDPGRLTSFIDMSVEPPEENASKKLSRLFSGVVRQFKRSKAGRAIG